MYWLEYWYAFPVAVVTATLAMSSGIGGGLLFAPLFMFVLHLTPEQAMGTSLLTEVFGMGTAFINYYRMRLINFKVGGLLILGSVPGALIGAILINLHLLNALVIKVLFGAVIIVLAFTIILRKSNGENQNAIQEQTAGAILEKLSIRKKIRMILLSFLAGLGVGTLALGSGEINTPQLVNTGFTPKVAIPTSVFVMVVTVITATSVYILKGQPVLNLALYTCSGVVVGAKLATSLIHKFRDKVLRWWLFGIFLLVGISIFVKIFQS